MNSEIDAMAAAQPTGSVVIPAYNEGATVGKSLRWVADVLCGSLADREWEIVVVDDGSTDDTAAQAALAAPDVEALGVTVRIVSARSQPGPRRRAADRVRRDLRRRRRGHRLRPELLTRATSLRWSERWRRAEPRWRSPRRT